MQKVFSVGIIVPSFLSSQMVYYSTKYTNVLLSQSNLYDIVFFYEQLAQMHLKPLCACMNISEIWSFSGLLVSTTIHNTILASKAIIPAKKVFYVWDLEWLRPGNQNYLYNIQAYRSPHIELVARSMDHAQVIENYCNRQVKAVIPNFQIDGFINVFYKDIK